jgi:amidohydrolase
VVSIGSINGGFTENVIPERVKLTGTLRFTEKRVQQQIHAEIQRAFEIAHTLGGNFDLKFEIGTPPMINSEMASDLIKTVAAALLGVRNVLPWKDELGAEDFGCFMETAPGAMFSLGSGGGNFDRHMHSPEFDLNENCLPVGAAMLAETALQFLRTPGG